MVLDRSEMRNCPECDVELKVKNLPRHLKRNHGIEIGNSTADIERAFNRKNKRKLASGIVIFPVLVTIILGVSIYYGFIYDGSDSGPGYQHADPFPMIYADEGMEEEHKQVKIPVINLTDEAQFFFYNSDGVKIRVFALLGSDEKPRVAFDASESAYSEKKGFRQSGDKMVDNAGNWEFDIDTIGVLTIDNERAPALLHWGYCCKGDNVAINITVLNAHRYMFE